MRSYLLGSLVSDDRLRRLVVGLPVTAGVATIALRIAIWLDWTFPEWWRPLAIIAGLFGLSAFGIFWNGQTRLLFDEGAVAADLDGGNPGAERAALLLPSMQVWR